MSLLNELKKLSILNLKAAELVKAENYNDALIINMEVGDKLKTLLPQIEYLNNEQATSIYSQLLIINNRTRQVLTLQVQKTGATA